MNTRSNTYQVYGIDVEVESANTHIEARACHRDQDYRLKVTPDSLTPCGGRFHQAMAIAEPVIPEMIYHAMVNAVVQHNDTRKT